MRDQIPGPTAFYTVRVGATYRTSGSRLASLQLGLTCRHDACILVSMSVAIQSK